MGRPEILTRRQGHITPAPARQQGRRQGPVLELQSAWLQFEHGLRAVLNGDFTSNSMTAKVAGAFDDFASAQAAVKDLRGSGIGDGNVQLTSNPKNPDGTPGTSLADEAATVPAILEEVASSVFNVGEHDPVEGRPIDEIGVGGIVVSVTMEAGDDPEVARVILARHHAVLLGSRPPG